MFSCEHRFIVYTWKEDTIFLGYVSYKRMVIFNCASVLAGIQAYSLSVYDYQGNNF